VYRLTWRLPLAGLVAFSHLQFSQIRGRQPYLILRKILYVISGPTNSRDASAISRWKESVIPSDCMTGRLGS
jgi:hypothetical protein